LSPRILISAGEASGDAHAARLVAALRPLLPDAEFFGVGGAALRAAGCETVVDARDVCVLGLVEVVAHLPRIYREFHRLLAEADRRRPDAAILVDFPDFNFRLARQLHARGIPVFYYISPQLWAWRAGRVKLVRRYIRKMLVIFPFEEQFYRARGVDAVYAGHPLADAAAPPVDHAAFAARHGLDPAKPWIALLPGSRRREVGLNLPEMLAAAARFGDECQFILPVASTLDRAEIAAAVASARPGGIILTDDARLALAHARAGIIASGTATLEAALIGTPFVMVYRVAPLTYALGRHLVRVPHFGIVNLILGRSVVPEFVQSDFTASRVEAEIRRLLADGPARRGQLAAFAELCARLAEGSGLPAAERAARLIVQSL
jgi:lipid-A-disaccharide synthase